MADLRRFQRAGAVLLALACAMSACAGANDPLDDDADAAPATTSSTQRNAGQAAVGGDLPDPAADQASDEKPLDQPGQVPPDGAEIVDAACANFRAFVVAGAPCGRLVQPAEGLACDRPSGQVIDCSALPSVVRVAQVSGAVVGGQPDRPDVDAVQFGRGPGPTNTALVIFTGAGLPSESPDRIELAVVYEDPSGVGCEATGEAWDGGSFASVLRMGPGSARITDLGCRPDGFAEIGQRSSWLVAGDLAIVYLPIDLPGAPARITGSFHAAPGFAPADGRIGTRRLDPGAWDFDDPINP